MSRRAIGTSSAAPIPARATSCSGASRGVEKPRRECAKTAGRAPKPRAKIRFWTRGYSYIWTSLGQRNKRFAATFQLHIGVFEEQYIASGVAALEAEFSRFWL